MQSDVDAARRLRALDAAVAANAPELALLLVYDRPERSAERAGLARAYFAQRCVSDVQLEQTVDAFRSVGAYVELFAGEQPLLAALAEGRIARLARRMTVVYNGIEGGIGSHGFAPGRKALIPSVADSYGVVCANSNAYACALGRHKFHYFTVLRALGIRTPLVWHFRPPHGWAGGVSPPPGTHVISKSTYESWSVGVTDDSIFTVDETLVRRVERIALQIGQAVTVQEFVPGPEVCVPVLGPPIGLVTPPVEAILAKAPGDPNAVMTIADNLEDAGVTYRRFTGPAPVIRNLELEARHAFDILELESFARIDFRIDDDGVPWVIDVGVSPGLSTGSPSYSSFAELGLDHPTFLRAIVGSTLEAKGLIVSSHARTRPQAS